MKETKVSNLQTLPYTCQLSLLANFYTAEVSSVLGKDVSCFYCMYACVNKFMAPQVVGPLWFPIKWGPEQNVPVASLLAGTTLKA